MSVSVSVSPHHQGSWVWMAPPLRFWLVMALLSRFLCLDGPTFKVIFFDGSTTKVLSFDGSAAKALAFDGSAFKIPAFRWPHLKVAFFWRLRFTGSQVHRFTGSQVHGITDPPRVRLCQACKCMIVNCPHAARRPYGQLCFPENYGYCRTHYPNKTSIDHL